MLGALLYLRLTSLRNRVVSRVKRLRQPKYLFGALVGAAYFYFIFFRQIGSATSTSRGTKRAAAAKALEALPAPETIASTLPLVAALGALLLLAIILVAWVIPSEKPGLRFTEAEAAFLFPAPVSRRTLINFKLLSSQFSILFTSLFFTLISNRWSFLGGNAPHPRARLVGRPLDPQPPLHRRRADHLPPRRRRGQPAPPPPRRLPRPFPRHRAHPRVGLARFAGT